MNYSCMHREARAGHPLISGPVGVVREREFKRVRSLCLGHQCVPATSQLRGLQASPGSHWRGSSRDLPNWSRRMCRGGRSHERVLPQWSAALARPSRARHAACEFRIRADRSCIESVSAAPAQGRRAPTGKSTHACPATAIAAAELLGVRKRVSRMWHEPAPQSGGRPHDAAYSAAGRLRNTPTFRGVAFPASGLPSASSLCRRYRTAAADGRSGAHEPPP